MGTRPLFLLGKKSIESSLPAGPGVGEINDCIFCHFIPPSCPARIEGLPDCLCAFSAFSLFGIVGSSLA
jgi:hypothetical protein